MIWKASSNFYRMQLKIYRDYNELSAHAADEIIELVKRKPDSVLCLAAGDTPRLTYEMVAKKAGSEKVNFSKVTFIGLDEWVGIPPENEGSCHYFFIQQSFYDAADTRQTNSPFQCIDGRSGCSVQKNGYDCFAGRRHRPDAGGYRHEWPYRL